MKLSPTKPELTPTNHEELIWLVYTLLLAVTVLLLNHVLIKEPFIVNYVGLVLCGSWAVLFFRASERALRNHDKIEEWVLALLTLLFCVLAAVFLWRATDIVRLAM